MTFRNAFANSADESCMSAFRFVSQVLVFLSILIAPLRGQTQNEETVLAEKFAPLIFAYAENDYTQKLPLVSALELGFRYIEADTFLIDDRLMIGNSVLDMQSKGSLESLYFAPIAKLVRDKSEWISRDDSPITLVIDVKSDAEPTYLAIRKLLNQYSAMLTKVVDGVLNLNAVTVIIAGNCARERIAAENPRLAAIDGRISDIDSDSPVHLIPIISARWGSHFRWQGKTQITTSERARLQSMVDRAHSKKRAIRFWSTPDVDIVWTALRTAGVDLIGAERFPALAEFVTPRKSPFESAN